MRRRNFLAGSGLALGTALIPGGTLLSGQPLKGREDGDKSSEEFTGRNVTPLLDAAAYGQIAPGGGNITALHAAVEKIAGIGPALVLSDQAIRSIILNNFTRSCEALPGGTAIVNSIKASVEGLPKIEVRLVDISITSAAGFTVNLQEINGEITAEISPSFTVRLALYVKGDIAKEFSRIVLTVSDLKVVLQGRAPFLKLKQPTFTVLSKVLASTATRGDALKTSSLSVEDVDRVEGALAYVTPERVIQSVFAVVDTIDLGKLYPSVRLVGELVLHRVSDGVAFTTTGGIEIIPPEKCPPNCVSVPEIKASSRPTATMRTDSADYSWTMTPGAYTKAPAKSEDVESNVDGFAALYLPKPVFEQRFSKILPAIEYRDGDNCFIGWEAVVTGGLTYAALALDPKRLGIVVDYGIRLDGNVYVTIDVPCVGRCDLASARVTVDPSFMTVFLGLNVTMDDKLALAAAIDKLDIGKVTAQVSAFSRYLSFAGGWGVVAGFILDYILKRVIEHNVPIKLREKITETINAGNVPLLDLGGLGNFARYRAAGFNNGTFSGSATSMLVGLRSNG